MLIWAGLLIWAAAIGIFLAMGQQTNVAVQLFGLAGFGLLIGGLVMKGVRKR